MVGLDGESINYICGRWFFGVRGVLIKLWFVI